MPDDGSAHRADLILFAASPLESAREFIRRRHMQGGTRTLHHQSGTFYGWQWSHYVERAAEEMRADLYDFLDRAQTHKPDEEGELVPFNPNRSKVANVAEALAAAAQLGQASIPPTWLDGTTEPPAGEVIACQNGLLHLPTRRLLAHTPVFFTLNALGFDFNPKAAAPANWLSFLRSIWPDDVEAISTLQELFGLCLTGDTRHQKAFLIVGPKRSGKGTIARVLTELLGQANVCGPTLS